MQRSGLRAEVFALFEDIGDVVAGEGLELEGVFDGAGDFVGAIDFAQSYDFGERFFQVIQDAEVIEHELMLRFLLFTSLRVSELVSMKVGC